MTTAHCRSRPLFELVQILHNCDSDRLPLCLCDSNEPVGASGGEITHLFGCAASGIRPALFEPAL